MNLISIIVPVYGNAASLRELLSRLQGMAGAQPERFEFVFVDDGSRDNSFEVLQALAAGESRVRVVKLSRNFGANAALLAGLEYAEGSAVAAISADLQDPPEIIADMLGHWRNGRKVVVATRESREDPGLTALFSKAFYALFRRFAVPSMPPGGFDCFLIDRHICELVRRTEEKNTYLMGLILWFGYEPAVVGYHRAARAAGHGRSMWTLGRKLKYFIDSFVAFSYLPVRAASVLGLAFAVLGLLYAGVVLLMALISGFEVHGWASLMIVLLVVAGVQLMMIGILGEYVWRSLEETRRRPRFVVERFIGPSERAAPDASGDPHDANQP